MKNSVQLIGKCSNISNCEYAIKGLFSIACVYYESGLCTNEEAIIDKIHEKIAIQKIQKM